MTKKVTAAELSRIRNRNVKRMKKAGARPDQIKSYLKGWSIPDNATQQDSDK